MELFTLSALGIVVYCGYVTVKDIIEDLYRERLRPIPVTVRSQAAGCRHHRRHLR